MKICNSESSTTTTPIFTMIMVMVMVMVKVMVIVTVMAISSPHGDSRERRRLLHHALPAGKRRKQNTVFPADNGAVEGTASEVVVVVVVVGVGVVVVVK